MNIKNKQRKLMNRIIMESFSFDDFLQRMVAENIIIEQGKSKNYGIVTKYRFPDEERFHRGYSLGSFYTDNNIKKRIARRKNSSYIPSVANSTLTTLLSNLPKFQYFSLKHNGKTLPSSSRCCLVTL